MMSPVQEARLTSTFLALNIRGRSEILTQLHMSESTASGRDGSVLLRIFVFVTNTFLVSKVWGERKVCVRLVSLSSEEKEREDSTLCVCGKRDRERRGH